MWFYHSVSQCTMSVHFQHFKVFSVIKNLQPLFWNTDFFLYPFFSSLIHYVYCSLLPSFCFPCSITSPLHFFFFFFLFRATPVTGKFPGARGQIGAVVAVLCLSHSSARFKLHLQPILQADTTPDP